MSIPGTVLPLGANQDSSVLSVIEESPFKENFQNRILACLDVDAK